MPGLAPGPCGSRLWWRSGRENQSWGKVIGRKRKEELGKRHGARRSPALVGQSNSFAMCHAFNPRPQGRPHERVAELSGSQRSHTIPPRLLLNQRCSQPFGPPPPTHTPPHPPTPNTSRPNPHMKSHASISLLYRLKVSLAFSARPSGTPAVRSASASCLSVPTGAQIGRCKAPPTAAVAHSMPGEAFHRQASISHCATFRCNAQTGSLAGDAH